MIIKPWHIVGQEGITRVEADATDFVQAIDASVRSLLKLQSVQQQNIRSFAKMTDEGIRVTNVVKALGSEGKRSAITFEQLGDSIRVVSVASDKATDKIDRQRKAIAAAARQQRIFANESRNAARSIAGPSFSITGSIAQGVTGQELGAFQEARARLRDIQERNELTSKEVLAVWRRVQQGRIQLERGATREIQLQLLRVLQAQQNLGRARRQALQAQSRDRLRALKQQDQAIDKTKELTVSFRTIARFAVFQIASRGLQSLITGLVEGTQEAAKFSIAIAEIQTIDRAGVPFLRWSTELRALSDEFGIPIINQAEAAYQALSNQIATGVNVTEFLRAANQLAVTAVTDVSDAVNLLTAALNAFRIDVARTDEISAKFFKTVELGRLRIQDLANIFGRVAVPAAQLGVTIDELNAAIAITTIRGVRAEEATTLLRNIFLKLIKPTEAMKDFLGELGVNSGQAAIEVFGLQGFMARLEEKTQGSTEELGKLFSRVRAITSALIFAGEGVQDFADAIDQVRRSGDTFNSRTAIVLENSGKRLEIAMNRVGNVFRVDVGQAALQALSDLTDGFEILAPAVQVLVVIATRLAVVVMPLLILAIGRASVALVRLGVTFFATPFGIFAAAIGLVTLALFELAAAEQRAAADIRQRSIEAVNAIDRQIAAEAKSIQERLENQREFLREREKLTQQAVANAIGTERKEINASIEGFELLTDSVEKNLKLVTAAAKTALADVEKQLTTLIKNAQATQQALDQAFEGAAAQEFELRFGAIEDDPARQVQLITDRIKTLRQESVNASAAVVAAQQALAQGLRTGAESDEIRALERTGEAQQRIFDEARKQAETLSARRARILIQAAEEGQRAQIINGFVRSNNQLLAEGVTLREKILESEKERIQILTDERDRLSGIQEELNKTFEAFKTFDIEDILKIGTLEDARTGFEEQEAGLQKILDLSRQLGDSILEREQIERLLKETQETRVKRLRELELEAAREVLRTSREKLNTEIKTAETIQQLDRDRIDELQRATAALRPLIEGDPRIRQLLVNTAIGQRGTLGGIAGVGGDNAQLDKISSALILLSTALAENNLGNLTVAIRSLQEATEFAAERDIEQALRFSDPSRQRGALAALREGGALGPVPEQLDETGAAIARNLQILLNAITVDPAEGENILTVFRRLSEQQGALNTLATQLQRNEQKQIEATGESTDQTAKFGRAISEANIQMGLFETNLEKLNTILANIPNGEGNSSGGFIRRQAGGLVGMGTDTVPAMLTPGEFVMNRESTSRFASQLVQMNSGIRPRGFQDGGMVGGLTNINISVTGTDNPQQTGIAIGNELRRLIRRGSIAPLS